MSRASKRTSAPASTIRAHCSRSRRTAMKTRRASRRGLCVRSKAPRRHFSALRQTEQGRVSLSGVPIASVKVHESRFDEGSPCRSSLPPRLCGELRARRGAGGVDDAGRGPRNAGLGIPQDRHRQAAELSPGIGRRRRGARALFDHRPRSRRGVACARHRGRDQPLGSDRPRAFVPCPEPPLAALRAFIKESRFLLPDSLPPMAAGVFGYLGYDMVRLMEDLAAPNPDPIGIPDAILVRPTVVIIFDSVLDTLTLVTPVRPAAGVTAPAALARAVDRLTAVVDALDRPLARKRGRGGDAAAPVTPCLEHDRPQNSMPWWRGPRNTSRPAIFSRWCWRSVSRRRSRCRRLRSIAHCAGSIRRRSCSISTMADFAVAGSSPEILVRTRGDTVTIRPIAGTQAARRDAARGQGAGGRTARRSEGARRTSDAARSRPQRCRPRRRHRHASRSPTSSSSSATAR